MSSIVTVKELVESGVHFGHQVSRWNPKMAPYIQTKRKYIHIIDLKATIRGLLRARHFLFRLASSDEQVLFVGTKRQVRSVVDSEATRAGMPCVTERWIGGSLTNFQTIRSRLKRLEELEEMESSGKMAGLSKKEQAKRRRELRKIKRNLDGIRKMDGLPGAVVVVDPKREYNAVAEANKLNIPVVAILDTDCDPDQVDVVIPGNDDAMRSVQLILSRLVDAVIEGKGQVSEEVRIQRKRRLEELEAAERDLLAPPQRERGPRRGGGGRGGPGGPGRGGRGGRGGPGGPGGPGRGEAPAEAPAPAPEEKAAEAPAEKPAEAPAPAPAPEAPVQEKPADSGPAEA